MNIEIKIYLIAWLLSHFEPLQDSIDYLWGLMPLKLTKMKVIDYIYIGLGCQKCLTLWIGLFFLEPFTALLLSFIAFIQEKLLKNGKK
jgi:hypothetical protein